MSSTVRAATKTQLRHLIRARGYDIVPIAHGFPQMQRLILSSTTTVVDVGANVGQFGERVRDLGFSGRIISFEPGSAACSILAGKAAREDDWDVRQVALGAAAGTAKLRVAANSVSSSLLDVGQLHVLAAPRSETRTYEDVAISTLDAELTSVPDDALYLKLDVQGFELPALTGGVAVLDRTRAVQLEVSFESLYEDQTDWLEVCRFLQDRGFIVRYLEPGYEDRASGFLLQADLLLLRDRM